MYAQHFGLNREPFSIAPDPRYLFMSERHREALAHLLYGLNGGGGFVLLTGEIGAGKTTVCRCFLEQIPGRCNVAYIFNPKLTVEELLGAVCEEFGVPLPPTQGLKAHMDALNAFLMRTHAVGQNNVLIIDEAQNLTPDVLEQLRLLTNLETNERKLLQIILIGQPELRAMLARPGLEQLAQRVIARFHLDALSQDETVQYIRHRLAVAGMKRDVPFDRRALQRVHELARGIPRRVNLLCDRALLGAYAAGRDRVDVRIVNKAASEVFDDATPAWRRWGANDRLPWLAGGLAAGALLAVMVGAFWTRPEAPAALVQTPPAASQTEAATAVPASPAAASASETASTGGVAASAPPSAAAAAPTAARMELPAVIRDENEAWRELARSWALDVDSADPCRQASQQQVLCYRATGSLALIRQLGRPVVLSLTDEKDRPFHALLTGLGSQTATLGRGAQAQTVTLTALAGMWRGEFGTLWRAPPGYGEAAAHAGSGQAAQWVASRLASLSSEGRPTAADGSEVPLSARVSAFQLAQGLKPDGLAGPITLMQLNRASGVDEPRLRLEP